VTVFITKTSYGYYDVTIKYGFLSNVYMNFMI